jgi:hypothetical protein
MAADHALLATFNKLGLKLIRETGANNLAIGYNVLPRWKD